MSKRKGDGQGYRVLRGISWPRQGGGWHDVEAPAVRTDLPARYVAGWIEVGAIEPADTTTEPEMALEEAR